MCCRVYQDSEIDFRNVWSSSGVCREFIAFEQMFRVRLTIMMLFNRKFLYRSMFKTSRESLTSIGFQFQHVQRLNPAAGKLQVKGCEGV